MTTAEYTPTTAELIAAVASFDTCLNAELAGWVFGAENAKLGDVAVIYSRARSGAASSSSAAG